MSNIPINVGAAGENRPKTMGSEGERSPAPRRPGTPETADKRNLSFESVAELHSFLEHRSRQWSMTIRLLEQQRQYLRSIEVQRDDSYRRLAEIMHMVDETFRNLKSATDKEEKAPADLDNLLEKNRKALEQLENIAAALSTNFVCWRSAWGMYAETCQKAKGLRAEMAASEPLTDA